MQHRRQSISVDIGNITVGGDAPIIVQSMTDTDTADAKATVEQIIALHQAGSELVRITVNSEEAARQVAVIKESLLAQNCDVPLIGDFHYNGHRLLTQFPQCAEALDKYRINPGNVGFGKKRDTQFGTMIEVANQYDKPVRIGVNWGSLDQDLLTQLMDDNAKSANPKSAAKITREALIQSALLSAEQARQWGMTENKIILSCKVSSVPELIAVYQDLAQRCDYALHLGLTEAGMGAKGIVASSLGIGVLLQQGIGDTIRTSLTPHPNSPRTQEVYICQQILQNLGLRAFLPQVASCPGCGRTTSTFYRELADKIQTYIQQQMPVWKRAYPGVEQLNIAVMGCIVNGPGESKHADIGISLPGSGEEPVAPVFIDGKKAHTLRGNSIAEDFQQILLQYIDQRFRCQTPME